MLFIFSTPVLIRHLWQPKTVIFLHRCFICAVLLYWASLTCQPNPKNFPDTNTLAYFGPLMSQKKSFISLAPGYHRREALPR
jgi:hypothetical protein